MKQIEVSFGPQEQFTVPMRRVCAWCNVILAEGDPARVSHGICAECSEKLVRSIHRIKSLSTVTIN
jgi:hypothetical protein